MLDDSPQNDHTKPAPRSLVMGCTVFFDGMTWANLRRFVELADQANIPNDTDVVIDGDWDERDCSFTPTGLAFYASDAPRTAL